MITVMSGAQSVIPLVRAHYSIHDLVDDAVGVLDSYGIHHAHFVGMSLGGMIA